MKAADTMTIRRMNFFLWFCVVGATFYLLDLHFYFSSKGSLLSSAIGAGFGAFLSRAEKHPRWQVLLSLLSPFVFIGMLYLTCPTRSALLCGLTIIGLCLGLWSSQFAKLGIQAGGRGELTYALKSTVSDSFLPHYSFLMRASSIAGLTTFVLHSIISFSWFALIWPAAIAVVLSSMVSSSEAEELQ